MVNKYLNIPASKPIIKDLRGEVLNNIIGPFPEGFNLILICEVDKGRPVPSVTWWSGSHLIDSTYTTTSNNILRNELIVGELKRDHLMRSFTCQASNSNISLPASTTVKLNVTLKPVDVKIIGERHPLSANTVHHVTCSTRGSLPSVHISWWKGSVKLVSNREEIIENGNATLNYLTFVPSADDNGKFLVCRAHNPSITPSTLEDSWKLDVHYVPQLNLRLGRNYSNIKEGTDVHFECDIKANPPINKVGWRFQNQDLPSNASKDILILNQTLYLKNIQRSSRGHYTCIATNSEGTGESNSVYLRVRFAPVCKQQDRVVVTTLNRPLNATCEVEADPSYVDIYWKSNTTAPIRYDVKGTTSVAYYLPESPEDIQDLLCWAANSVGIQKSPCVVKLVPVGNVNSTERKTDNEMDNRFKYKDYKEKKSLKNSKVNPCSAAFITENLFSEEIKMAENENYNDSNIINCNKLKWMSFDKKMHFNTIGGGQYYRYSKNSFNNHSVCKCKSAFVKLRRTRSAEELKINI